MSVDFVGIMYPKSGPKCRENLKRNVNALKHVVSLSGAFGSSNVGYENSL